jgi:hypothetical protein
VSDIQPSPGPPCVRVALFGAGARGLQVLASLRADPRLEVVGFFDNDPKKWQTTLHGLPVSEPTAEHCHAVDVILVASLYAKDILAQLTRLGFGAKTVLSPPHLTRRLGGRPADPGADDDRTAPPAVRRQRLLDRVPAGARALAARVDVPPPAPGLPSAAHRREVGCTICCNNYLAYATVLARSFLRQHPEGRFFIGLADLRDDSIAYPADPRITILEASTLGIPGFESVAFKYDVLEFNTAIKPYLLERLLRDYDVERLLYLDPDILVLSPLDELFDALERTPLILTPHLLGPYVDDHHPREIDILRAGTFNLGFVGVAAHAQTWALLAWWQARLYDGCTREVDKGYFVDQKWMDFVPSFFPAHLVIRDPGCNAAYWNLHERPVHNVDGTFCVNGRPLRFFHFSGIDVHDLDSVSKHQTRWTLPPDGALRDLFELYRVLLVTHEHLTLRSSSYGYGRFANGVRIPDIVRTIYRESHLSAVYPHPFSAGAGSYFDWLRAPWRPQSAISNLFASLRARGTSAPAPALQLGADDEFTILLEKHAAAERHDLPTELVDPAPAAAAPTASAAVAAVRPSSAGKGVGHAPQVVGRHDTAVPDLIASPLAAAIARAHQSRSTAGDTVEVAYWLWDDSWTLAPTAHDDVEVWVPSSYSQAGASRVASVPVVYIPTPVGAMVPSGVSRAALGLPERAHVLVSVADALTLPALALADTLTAFARVRHEGGPQPATLVVATTDTSTTATIRRLVAACPGPHGVMVRQLATPDLLQLLHLGDCYVSLHAHLACDPWMAHALWARRPAVTTHAAGTTDIATVNNSYLVATVPGTDLRPDVDHAAAMLRHALTNDAERQSRGDRAGRDLDQTHTVDAVARQIARRFDVMAARSSRRPAAVGAR